MPTNVSTSFFFINLLFQARRAGSNPRPSCIPRCVAARDKSRGGGRPRSSCARARPSAWVLNSRCVAARDKSRPGRRAMARAHQEGCARARPSAWVLNSRCVAARDKSRPWQLAIARAHQEGCARARPSAWVLNSRLGVLVPSGDRSGLTEPAGETLAVARAHQEIAHVRGVWLVGDWKGLAIGEFGRAQCIWIGQNPRAGWGQGAVLGFLARLGGAETGLGRTVSSLALPKNWMQKTQEYQ